MCRLAHSSESHIVSIYGFLFSYCQNNFDWLSNTICSNFLVLQVYTSFSFSFEVYKVVQALSHRRRCKVAETSSQLFLNLLGLQQVSETSPSSRTQLVAATSPRPTGDLKKSPKSLIKKSNMFDFTATSPRLTETRVAIRSPTSLQASEIGP